MTKCEIMVKVIHDNCQDVIYRFVDCSAPYINSDSIDDTHTHKLEFTTKEDMQIIYISKEDTQ